MMKRWVGAYRWHGLVLLLAIVLGIGASGVDACKRCSVELCIDVPVAGYQSCSERLIFIFPSYFHVCELEGYCSFGGGGEEEEECGGIPRCGPFDPYP